MTGGTALAELKPDHLEDERLVKVIESVGAPPPYRKRPGVPGAFTQEHKDWVVSFLTEIPSPRLAAEILGIATSTLKYFRRQDPAFRIVWDEAMESAHDTIVGAAAEEALGIGVDHIVTKDGKVLAIKKKRSERLLEAWLKFRLGERHIHEGGAHEPGTMVLAVTPSQLNVLTRDERRELTRLLSKIELADDGKPQLIEHDAA